MANFAAEMSAWGLKAEERMTAIWRESAQRVVNEVSAPFPGGTMSEGPIQGTAAQAAAVFSDYGPSGVTGNMPVITGNLRRSLLASTSGMPEVREGAKFEDPFNDIKLTIAGAEPGQTIYLGFQAAYAGFQESRYAFVRLTAQRWAQIVSESARDIQERTEGQ